MIDFTDTSRSCGVGLLDTGDLSFESTVDRRLVHRAAVSEVLITDWRKLGKGAFRCAVQWPRGHVLYSSADGYLDSTVVPESIRQIGILIAHVGYGVPECNRFIMKRLRFSCEPDLLYSPTAPLNVVADTQVTELHRRPDGSGGKRIDVRLSVAGSHVAEGSGWVRYVSPTVYRRLRGSAGMPGPADIPPVTPARPASVGRNSSRDVVVGPADHHGTYPLRTPVDHPVYFDHPLDHVPGSLVFEAMRQAAVATAGSPEAAMVAADAAFPFFLDLDGPCQVQVDRQPPDPAGRRFDIRFVQHGRAGALGSVILAERRRRPRGDICASQMSHSRGSS
jgi:hypothetical protein